MWFRSINGELIEINRKDYISCSDYYTSIMKRVYDINKIEKESVLDNVLNIIKNK